MCDSCWTLSVRSLKFWACPGISCSRKFTEQYICIIYVMIYHICSKQAARFLFWAGSCPHSCWLSSLLVLLYVSNLTRSSGGDLVNTCLAFVSICLALDVSMLSSFCVWILAPRTLQPLPCTRQLWELRSGIWTYCWRHLPFAPGGGGNQEAAGNPATCGYGGCSFMCCIWGSYGGSKLAWHFVGSVLSREVAGTLGEAFDIGSWKFSSKMHFHPLEFRGCWAIVERGWCTLLLRGTTPRIPSPNPSLGRISWLAPTEDFFAWRISRGAPPFDSYVPKDRNWLERG